MDPLNINWLHQLAHRHSLEVVELGVNSIGAYWTTSHDKEYDLQIMVNIHNKEPWPLLNKNMLELGLDRIVVIDTVGRTIITQSIEFFDDLGANGQLDHTWRSTWAYKIEMLTSKAQQILNSLLDQSPSENHENDDCIQGIYGL